MSELVPGILMIPPAGKLDIATFAIEGDDGVTLVDVGWKSAPTKILAALAEEGHKPSDVKRIVLTHAHPDHVQGAAELRRRTGAAIMIHHDDAPWLEAGRVPRDGRSGGFGRFVDRFPRLHWEPFEADVTLSDGQIIDGTDGLRVIHTPGHSPGHIVLHHEPSGAVLVGDAVFNHKALELGPAAMAADPDMREGALVRLPHKVDAVGFAHGPALSGRGTGIFEEFLSELRESTTV